ncbi:MAG: dethiobiotin synthase [Pseudomonadota bacterium]|nr:dethiobiotin synthase [Pseudomonadota bacterium]
MPNYFITGTDTGVGKTFVTCALLHNLREQGIAAIGMKPIAAGADMTPDGLRNEDIEALRNASGIPLEREDLNCYLFAEPIAPHIAAANEDVEIDLDIIRQRFDQLAELADMVLVEGVGGFIVPLGDTIDSADLATDLDLPVILVVGMRLGCLSHALLTQEAILARGLTLAGWVANQIDPHMAELDANVEALEERIRAPLLGVIEWRKQPDPAGVPLNFP